MKPIALLLAFFFARVVRLTCIGRRNATRSNDTPQLDDFPRTSFTVRVRELWAFVQCDTPMAFC